ncbi:hypothetical protein C8Q78DRAFT_544219 [Trametes maxima]|nr:hypothetical protein C8Q78DRAFT_544219 [Trametes maxima]
MMCHASRIPLSTSAHSLAPTPPSPSAVIRLRPLLLPITVIGIILNVLRLLNTMRGTRKAMVVTVEDFFDAFIPTTPQKRTNKAFHGWDKFPSMGYHEISRRVSKFLNKTQLISGSSFIPIRERNRDVNVIWAALWPDGQAPVVERRAPQSVSLAHLFTMDLPIIFRNWNGEDPDGPFAMTLRESDVTDEQSALRAEVFERVLPLFMYQQRTHCFAIVVIDDSICILRVDRSGIVSTKPLSTSTRDGRVLYDFLDCYSRLSPEERGWDPTFETIPHDSPLGQHMRDRAKQIEGEDEAGTYARSVFAKSLDTTWPWLKIAVDDDTAAGGRREFLVGKPHYYTGDVFGRGSRGYVALDATDLDGRFVYLKDIWRPLKTGFEREGVTVKHLNERDVPHVPVLVCHGDVPGQTTKSRDLWIRYGPEDASEEFLDALSKHQHYRIVTRDVCKPLEDFTDSRKLVYAFWCCVHGEFIRKNLPPKYRKFHQNVTTY